MSHARIAYVSQRQIESQLETVTRWAAIAGRDPETADIFASQVATLAKLARARASQTRALLATN